MNHIPYAIDNATLFTLVHVLSLIQTRHHHTLTAGDEPPLISDGGLGRLGKSLLISDIIIDGKTLRFVFFAIIGGGVRGGVR